MSRTRIEVIEVRFAEVHHEGELYKVMEHGHVAWWENERQPYGWNTESCDFPHEVEFIRSLGLGALKGCAE